MSYGYVYLIKDHFRNKIYVGQSKRLGFCQINNYFGSGRIIRSIIRKRKHLLEKIILGYCETQKELNEAEKICIEFYQSNNFIYGYNIREGGNSNSGLNGCKNGMFGKNHSNESKLKMKQTMKQMSCHKGNKNGRYVKMENTIIQKIIMLYVKKHIGCRGIEKELKIPFNRIKRVLIENNITLRNQSESMKGKTPWNKKI